MEEVNDKNSEMKLEWVPLKRIGPFVFGSMVDDYIAKYKLKLYPEEFNEKVGWDVYRGDNDISIYSEMGKIEAVSCSAQLHYQGKNIIGTSIEKVISILNLKPDNTETEELVEGPQVIYDFDEVGLQIWTKKNLVVTAICNGPANGN